MDLVNPDQDVKDGIRVSAVKYPPPVMMNVTKQELVHGEQA